MSTPIEKLFNAPLNVVNFGLHSFAENLKKEHTDVIHVDWQPPAGGHIDALNAIDYCMAHQDEINTANQEALKRLVAAQPQIVGIGKALDTIPNMHERLILHSGPPVSWEKMSGPTKGAVMGGLVYEGLAKTPEDAAKLAASGEIEFAPCHHHHAVGPMAGIITPKMPVWIIENQAFGNRAYSTLNEGLGKVLRYGAYGKEVFDRLDWMEKTLAPILKEALEKLGPIDLKSLIAQALQMGDEVHNRNRAATSLFIRLIAPVLVESSAAPKDIADVLRFLDSNDHFFLNLSMPASKAALMPCEGIKHSTMISIMARNGTEFGIQLASMPGKWFTAPAPIVKGLYLPGFSADDAAPDIGDSVITETAGIGGFAMAAAPAIVQFVGGNAPMALSFTNNMYEITLGEHPAYKIPALDFRGTPVGIDVRKVVEHNILPVINTGIAHKTPGIGMVGAGLVEPPMSCYRNALIAFTKDN